MENKKSSIELFIEQLEEKGKAYEETVGVRTVNICIDVSEYMELKQQAKAMHKEEITNTYDDAIEDVRQDEERPLKGLEYYNVHFKKNSI